ncbi:MAG: hypothetical protein ACYS8W_06595 [Planctomycetota bacterium]|jgi:hypothetical protein
MNAKQIEEPGGVDTANDIPPQAQGNILPWLVVLIVIFISGGAVAGIFIHLNAKLRRAEAEMQEKFSTLLEEKAALEKDLAALTRLVTNQHRDLSEIRKYLSTVKYQRNDLLKQLEAIRKNGLSADSLVRGTNQPAIDGIVAAYKADVKLVVINVGKEHGVREGYTFTIFDGEDFVAQVEVEKVMPKLCGCRVIFRQPEIKEGMKATTRPDK